MTRQTAARSSHKIANNPRALWHHDSNNCETHPGTRICSCWNVLTTCCSTTGTRSRLSVRFEAQSPQPPRPIPVLDLMTCSSAAGGAKRRPSLQAKFTPLPLCSAAGAENKIPGQHSIWEIRGDIHFFFLFLCFLFLFVTKLSTPYEVCAFTGKGKFPTRTETRSANSGA